MSTATQRPFALLDLLRGATGVGGVQRRPGLAAAHQLALPESSGDACAQDKDEAGRRLDARNSGQVEDGVSPVGKTLSLYGAQSRRHERGACPGRQGWLQGSD